MSEIFEVEPEYGNSAGRVNCTGYNGSKWREIRLDKATRAISVVEIEHFKVHSGEHFNYCDYDLNKAAGTTMNFVMVTPDNTNWVHLKFEASASNGVSIELYEGASIISGGTQIIPRNNNRNSATTSNVILYKNPSIGTDGTRAAGFLAGGGKTGGFVKSGEEFMLGQNKAYLVRMTSLTVNNDISWSAEWYHNTDKD